MADPRNNALIVQCSPEDFELIQETIRELDRVPRQVLINVRIYEVVLTDELSLGVSAFLQDRNRPTVPSPSATTASFGAGGAVSAGLNLATRALMGDTRELVAFLNAAETRTRSRVLSAPTVIASDNVTANIQVGASIPTLTSQGVIPGGTGGGSLFSNTISNRNTGVILSVTPRINAGGWVTLAVRQEVSSPGAPPTAGIQSPTINIRSVETQVTIKNGQTIAIGGIISETKGTSRNQVPLLGSIPVVGLLFGTTTRTTERTELIALITPQVIEDIEQASDLTEELKSTLKGLKKELSRDESWSTKGIHEGSPRGLARVPDIDYHSPLEGESQKPSRQAKADAVGGGRRPAKLRINSALPERIAFPERCRQGLAPVPLTFTHGAGRLPLTGSTAGSALSPTPPQGGSDTGAPYASGKITPPLQGESLLPSRQAKADADGGCTPASHGFRRRS